MCILRPSAFEARRVRPPNFGIGFCRVLPKQGWEAIWHNQIASCFLKAPSVLRLWLASGHGTTNVCQKAAGARCMLGSILAQTNCKVFFKAPSGLRLWPAIGFAKTDLCQKAAGARCMWGSILARSNRKLFFKAPSVLRSWLAQGKHRF